MAIVRAPGGKKYDTVRRVFLDEPIGNSSSTVFTPSDTVYRRPRSNNIWERISNSISGIGDWFDYNATTFSNDISFIFHITAWISLGIGVIGQWITSGFWTALITAAIGGIIVHYAAEIAKVILMYILWGCFKVMRYIFYNIYTLLIAVAIVITVIFSNQIDIPQNRTTTTSNPVSNLPNYYCDVNTTLNVREHPRSNAQVIGQLKRYDEIYVHSISNGFAKIDFKGRNAYVSAEYLKPKGELTSINTSTQSTNRNKTTETPSKVINTNISATINRIWEEHNVFQDQQKGMKIHVKFNTYNMQNMQGRCIAYFYHNNGAALKDNNNSYRSSDGQVSVGQNFKPGYKETLYEDFILFIPYNELHLPSEGRTNLKARIVLQGSSTTTQSKKLATSDWIYFWYGKLE
jgi:uncharacterized protein YgiM (DUF1202 family)